MTNIIFPRKEFEKHIKITKDIEEKISLFGTPLERLDQDELEIEVFPNRPDLISLQGFLRGFKAFLSKETGLKQYKINKPEKNYKVKIDKSVKPIRPYTACAIVKNLQFTDEKIKSIIDLQEKLHITLGRNRKKVAIGIYPLEKITLPITYTAQDPRKIKFQPLDSQKELTGIQVLQRHPTGKKYAHLLKGQEKFPIFIDAKNKILSMPPIINSNDIGKISESTKEVFIECSGHDLKILNKTLNIIVTTLAEMSGKIYQMTLQDSKATTTPNLEPQQTTIKLKNINKLLGLDLKQKDIPTLLNKMGHDYKSPNVYSPAWRTDILHEVDIAEDIAIAYGYNNFKPEIPEITTIGQESKKSKIDNKITELLLGLEATETSSFHLIKPQESKLMKIQKPLEVLDSKTEYKFLRPNLLIPTLRILSENLDSEYPQKIFELGTVFQQNDSKETQVQENHNLIIAITPGNFTEAKQHLDYLFSQLGLDYKLQESEETGFIPGRTAKIQFNDKPIGIIGEIHPITLRKLGLKMPLAIVEISLGDIYKEL